MRIVELLVSLTLFVPALFARDLKEVVISPRGASLRSGSSLQFKASCKYQDGTEDDCTGAGGVRWRSTAPKSMKVSSTGVASWTGEVASKEVGIGLVLVSAGGKTDRATVYAQHPGDVWYQYPTPDFRNFELEGTGLQVPLNVAVGSTVTMGSGLVINNDASQGQTTGRPLHATCNWSSSDPSRATVDHHGQVTGLAPGPVAITCVQAGDAAFGKSTMKDLVAPGNVVQLTIVAGGDGNTTWYVRPDGGTVFVNGKLTPLGQCNGKSNRPYPGKGLNQPCAVANIRSLWADGEPGSPLKWMISGGDTVMVAPNPIGYNTGLDSPSPYQNTGAGKVWSPINCSGNPTCTMPSIPSGTAARHTRILGENFSNCRDDAAKSKLIVSYAARAGFDVKDSQFVDIQCFEITDKADCSTDGNFKHSCAGGPSNYGVNGILQSALTSHVLYTDLFIHGLASEAIFGAAGVGVVADHVHIRGVPTAGIDMDDGAWQSGNISVAGGFTLTNSITEFAGCVEEYPIIHQYPLIECRDQNTGAYGDGFGTASTTGDWVFDRDIWRYNYQDGLDLLHSGMQSLVVTNSQSYGNDGQSYKLGAADSVIFRNNISLANCNRILSTIGDEPSSAIVPGVVGCRANGDHMVIIFTDVGSYQVQANTFAGYGSVMWDMMCENGWEDCSHADAVYQSNVAVGMSAAGYNDGQSAAIFYQGTPGMPAQMGWKVRDHNLYFNGRNGSPCPGKRGEAELCTSPLWANQPPLKVRDESSLDSFRFIPSEKSPLLRAGLTVPGLGTDVLGSERGPKPAIGAVEYRPVVPTLRQEVSVESPATDLWQDWFADLKGMAREIKVRVISPCVQRLREIGRRVWNA